MNLLRQALIVFGLGWGDENKGGTVDFLTREYNAHTVVRHNGGGQAGHNVVTEDGRHHTFSQFGSGTFVPGVRTHLSRFMLVNPITLFKEEEHLREVGITNALQRLSVDGQAPLTTPFHMAMNQLREQSRGDSRHGSCGLGIGETVSDILTHGNLMPRIADLTQSDVLRDKLYFLQQQKIAEVAGIRELLPSNIESSYVWRVLHDPNAVSICMEYYRDFANQVEIVDSSHLNQLLSESGTVIFEGAQGVLLDESWGFHPYTTWSNTTTDNADTLLAEADYAGQVIRIGLVRSYATRHGAGPFVTEDNALLPLLPEPHNNHNPWQHGFRVGAFDEVAIRYALQASGGIDFVAVSHLDRLSVMPGGQRCVSYRHPSSEAAHRLCDLNEDGEIIRLKLGRKKDRTHRSELTDLLMGCQPVYNRRHDDYGARATCRFLSEMEEVLGVPIGLTSHGPTAQDKTLEALSLAA